MEQIKQVDFLEAERASRGLPSSAQAEIEARKLARDRDPISSLQTARDLVRSGEHQEQCETVLGFLKIYPGCTAQELARYHSKATLGRMSPEASLTIFYKRLPDLRRAGRAFNGDMRICSISKRRVQTWGAK